MFYQSEAWSAPINDLEPSCLPPILAFPVFIVIVLHAGIRESTDEFGLALVRLSGRKQPFLYRPFVHTHVDGVEGQSSGETILANPRLCDVTPGEDATWKVPSGATEHPYRRSG